LNPRASYFHVSELLRSEFYPAVWDIQRCRRHRIVFTNGGMLYRGLEVLVEALSILKKDFPDVSLGVSGVRSDLGYGHKLLRTAQRFGVASSVDVLGFITARQMVDELRGSHVFALASFIENSPNSLCEAQLVGMPCVASYVGGIPSLVEEGVTGWMYPVGDAVALAKRIRDIFLNDDLAISLGQNARQAALQRHDPSAVTASVLETYRSVIQESRSIRTRSKEFNDYAPIELDSSLSLCGNGEKP
jgi:glycosyltransferase involved in cell wall biosynthesis